jgi:hypothetical protein
MEQADKCLRECGSIASGILRIVKCKCMIIELCFTRHRYCTVVASHRPPQLKISSGLQMQLQVSTATSDSILVLNSDSSLKTHTKFGIAHSAICSSCWLPEHKIHNAVLLAGTMESSNELFSPRS